MQKACKLQAFCIGNKFIIMLNFLTDNESYGDRPYIEMKIYRLLLCLIAFTFSACQHEIVPPNKKYILDRWQVKAFVTTHYKNKVKTSTTSTTTFGPNDYLQFNKDGTGYFGLKGPNASTTFGAMKYSVSGSNEDIVNVTNEKGAFVFHIISADQTALRITYPDDTTTIPIADGDYYDVQLTRH